MTPSAKTPDADTQPDLLQHGGMWERQRLLGGDRLTDEYAQHESFILWDIAVVGDIPVGEDDDGNPRYAKKVELTTSHMESPDDKKAVGALGAALVSLAEEPQVDGDLPAVVHWDTAETKRKLQPALVLVAERQYTA